MAMKFLLSVIVCILSLYPTITHSMHLETYIIHLSLPEGRFFEQFEDQESWYHSYLPNSDPSRIVHTYRDVITGFAAKLSPNEVKEMEKMDGFLYATPNMKYTLHTTHTPNFLGLYQNHGSWSSPGNYGKGVIIGLLDGGITPDHLSFNDKGMPPPPTKWKGECESNSTLCNNKLIGTRNSVTPGSDVDHDSHGTHTSSTAAGNFVENANVFGQAKGTASGIAPLAHVAMYQVCTLGCSNSDILAGMDAAIHDKVDVLSISLGGYGGIYFPFYADVIAIGAFRAMQKGITVVCSAGNSGPTSSTLSNEAPWIMTVGASSPDRKILASAALGNGDEFEGESLNQTKDFPSALLPLIYPGNNKLSALCLSLDGIDVKGKVVLCDYYDPITQGTTVKEAGGAAIILITLEEMGYTIVNYPILLPAVQVSYDAGQKIKAYINSTSDPKATILFKGTVIGDKRSPSVASFSSRGPNLASPGILKPDIIGPGLNILAGWPFHMDGVSDKEIAAFHMISGTSMSCPHISGVSALIKSDHPSWTPAMIKSAIMTSATQVNVNGSRIVDQWYQPVDVFGIGAGHVNPTKALDPGLVYDISTRDYISYLCFLYTKEEVEIIVGQKIDCQGDEYKGVPEAQLNYPSFSVALGSRSQMYSRTVTNVGEAKSTYQVQIESVPGVIVTVDPPLLAFTRINEKKTYMVHFTREDMAMKESYVEGALSWVSAQHKVRTPVSVKLVNN